MRKLLYLILFLLPNISYSQFTETLTNYTSSDSIENISNEGMLDGGMSNRGIGQVTCIEVNPKNEKEIYIGTKNGGFWRTKNGGKNWKCLTDNLPGAGFKFAVNPKDFNTVYVTTGLHATGGSLLTNGYFGDGIYKTTNGGKTWRRLNIPKTNNLYLSEIKLSHTSPDIIIASSLSKLYISKDKGETWDVIKHNIKNGSIRKISFLNNSNDFILLSGRNILHKYYFKTKKFESIIPKPELKANKAFESNVSIYKGIITASFIRHKVYNSTFYKTLDFGKSWQSQGKIGTTQRLYISLLKHSPDGVVFVGGIRLYKFVDSMKVKNISYKLHADIRYICFPDTANPDLIYVGTDGDINKTENGGKSWLNISGDLCTSLVFSVAISEQNNDLYAIGTTDCGTMIRGSNKKWSNVYGGDGGTCLIDYSDTSRIWLTCNGNIKMSTLFRNRLSFRGLKKRIIVSPYDPVMKQNPKNPEVIYICSSQIMRYEKYGNKKTYHFNPKNIKGRISAFDISSSDTSIIYFASDGIFNKKRKYPTLWKNTGGYKGRYENIGKTLKFLKKENLAVTKIIVHPKNSKKVWISLTGFSKKNKIFYSNTGGITWKNISYNIDNYPVNTLAYDKKSKTLYAGTDIGLYKLKIRHKKWKRFKKMPITIVSDLKINTKTRELIIATYGRGIWKLSIK